MRWVRLLAATGVCAGLLAAAPPAVPSAGAATGTATPIKHIVVLMQSGRSFDNYFGTYPGADGIPSGTCLPANTRKPKAHACVRPYHLGGAPAGDLDHGYGTWARQYDRGRMDGFVSAYRRLGLSGVAAMGYYDQRDLPFYWNVARSYVLFDRFFSSAPVGVRVNRFWWVAGRATPGGGEKIPAGGYGQIPTIFDRLTAVGVSWKMYVQNYDPRVTYRTAGSGQVSSQISRVPLVGFARFIDDPGLAGHISDASTYYADLRRGTLPAVAFMAASTASENPPGSPQAGQKFVYQLTSALEMSSYWSTSAFMWTYDNWGGWYDNVKPPRGWGFRVPALLVSAYARHGYVDHATMDYTAILKFIAENWHLAALSGRAAQSPGLASAFDFSRPPRPAELLADKLTTTAPPNAKSGVVYSVYAGELLLVIAVIGWAVWRSSRRRPGRGRGGLAA
jgi:phospholipase C